MSTITYQDALQKVGVSVPDHLIADAEVPVLTGPQAQGDLMIVPLAEDVAVPADAFKLVPAGGVQVVFGEATGNSHFLHQGFDSPGVEFARLDEGLVLGVVRIPEGQTAHLIHTDEHGANGIGAGDYAIHAKREQADEIRRVQD